MRVAVDRRQHRLRRTGKRHLRRTDRGVIARAPRRIGRVDRELADVGPGAERPALPGHDEQPHRRVGHGAVDEAGNCLPHREVEGIALGRTPQRQRRARTGDAEVEIGHDAVSAITPRRASPTKKAAPPG